MKDQVDLIARCPDCGRIVIWADGSWEEDRLEQMKRDWRKRDLSVERILRETVKGQYKATGYRGHKSDCPRVSPRWDEAGVEWAG